MRGIPWEEYQAKNNIRREHHANYLQRRCPIKWCSAFQNILIPSHSVSKRLARKRKRHTPNRLQCWIGSIGMAHILMAFWWNSADCLCTIQKTSIVRRKIDTLCPPRSGFNVLLARMDVEIGKAAHNWRERPYEKDHESFSVCLHCQETVWMARPCSGKWYRRQREVPGRSSRKKSLINHRELPATIFWL